MTNHDALNLVSDICFDICWNLYRGNPSISASHPLRDLGVYELQGRTKEEKESEEPVSRTRASFAPPPSGFHRVPFKFIGSAGPWHLTSFGTPSRRLDVPYHWTLSESLRTAQIDLVHHLRAVLWKRRETWMMSGPGVHRELFRVA